MALSWSPRLFTDRSFGTSWSDGEPIDFGMELTDTDESLIYFIVTPESVAITIPRMTQIHTVVLANSGTVGDLVLSVWRHSGLNEDPENFVTFTGLEFNPWTWTQAVLPFAGAEVVLDQNVEGGGSVDVTYAEGPVVGSIVSVGTITAPVVTYPGDVLSTGTYFRDVDPGDGPWVQSHGYLRTFASDLPGTFAVASSTMRRVLLVGPDVDPPAASPRPFSAPGRSSVRAQRYD